MQQYNFPVKRIFTIDNRNYIVSAISNTLEISYKLGASNAVSEISVSFGVKTRESAINLVETATANDIKRGINKMKSDFLFARMLNSALKNSLNNSNTDNGNYDRHIPKYLKR